MAQQSSSGWSFDRKINIPMAVGLLAQTVALVAYIVSSNVEYDYRLRAVEKASLDAEDLPRDFSVLDLKIKNIQRDVDENADQLDRIEDKIDALRATP